MTPRWKWLRLPTVTSVMIGLAVSLAIVALRLGGFLQGTELAFYDWLIRLQPPAAGHDPRILLVTATEQDIRNQGRWPLTDATLAEVLERLSRAGPRAIGLDIYRDIPVPPGHARLEKMLSTHPNIVVVSKIGPESKRIPPPRVLSDTDQVGFNDLVVDPGGIVRRGLLYLDDEDRTLSSFALRLALLYLAPQGIAPRPDPDNPEYLRLGEVTLRPLGEYDGGYVRTDARGYQILLDFKNARAKLPSVSLTGLLAGEVDHREIRDKIVLIGVTAESVPDIFYTPYSAGIQTHDSMPGVEVHAQIVSQLLRAALEGNKPISSLTEAHEIIWIMEWGILGCLLGLWVRSPWRLAAVAATGLGILFVIGYAAFLNRWWLPVVPPALSWLASSALVTAYMSNQEKRQRAVLMQLFSRHVAPEVVQNIWQRRDEFLENSRPRPQELTATVLFTDLLGFTSVSEKLKPEALMDWLNEYMEAMAQPVMKYGGVIDKYIGDSIMAVFGIPLPRKSESEIAQDAQKAVMCALAMEQDLIRLNNQWRDRQLPTIGMRIGIFTGSLVAGSLGSAKRLEYTVLGDTVNVASRLESFDKTLFVPDFMTRPCRILVGGATANHLGGRFEIQEVGAVKLKGKEHEILIYRVIGPAKPVGVVEERT
jgi:adenylate cyclase